MKDPLFMLVLLLEANIERPCPEGVSTAPRILSRTGNYPLPESAKTYVFGKSGFSANRSVRIFHGTGENNMKNCSWGPGNAGWKRVVVLSAFALFAGHPRTDALIPSDLALVSVPAGSPVAFDAQGVIWSPAAKGCSVTMAMTPPL